MVSTCGESLPPSWPSSFQTVDPLLPTSSPLALTLPSPFSFWCHPSPPLQPRPSPLGILTPATARVAPWLLLRAAGSKTKEHRRIGCIYRVSISVRWENDEENGRWLGPTWTRLGPTQVTNTHGMRIDRVLGSVLLTRLQGRLLLLSRSRPFPRGCRLPFT